MMTPAEKEEFYIRVNKAEKEAFDDDIWEALSPMEYTSAQTLYGMQLFRLLRQLVHSMNALNKTIHAQQMNADGKSAQ